MYRVGIGKENGYRLELSIEKMQTIVKYLRKYTNKYDTVTEKNKKHITSNNIISENLKNFQFKTNVKLDKIGRYLW